jgi:hypothetical protein
MRQNTSWLRLVFFDRLCCTNFNEALEWTHQFRSLRHGGIDESQIANYQEWNRALHWPS